MRLAANATGSQKIQNPQFEETLDNPTCGDRITLQVTLKDGRIAEFSQENRACLLCQASASLLAENAIGLNLDDVNDVMVKIRKILETGDGASDEPWEKLTYFAPVKEHKSRHICVMLPFNALQKILATEDK